MINFIIFGIINVKWSVNIFFGFKPVSLTFAVNLGRCNIMEKEKWQKYSVDCCDSIDNGKISFQWIMKIGVTSCSDEFSMRQTKWRGRETNEQSLIYLMSYTLHVRERESCTYMSEWPTSLKTIFSTSLKEYVFVCVFVCPYRCHWFIVQKSGVKALNPKQLFLLCLSLSSS